MPAAFDWNDLGAWGSLYDKLDKDSANNAVINSRLLAIDATNNLIRMAGLHFVIAMIWQCLLALMVRQAKCWLQKPGVSRVFDGITGTVMVGLGVRVAIES